MPNPDHSSTSENPTKISVALCTFNGEKYLKEQLESIVKQSRPVDEIVVSDDGSTDRTLEIVKILAKANPQISWNILESKSSLGVTANFERAISNTTGNFILLSDQDDIWRIDRVAVSMMAFERDPQTLLFHSDARLVDSQGSAIGGTLFKAIGYSRKERGLVSRGKALTVLLRRNTVTGATTAFKRELFELAKPFPPSWVHDEWLTMFAAIFGRIESSLEGLIDYRQHDSNQIGAAAPTISGRVQKLVESRSKRNARLLARATDLANRINSLGKDVSQEVHRLVAGKLEHEQFRSALPNSRFKRIIPIKFEALRGRYSRFGRARFDIPRDLLQPPD
ncbi:MAG: glycosyltransferase family 2 protein [Cryobacterium sp.]|nr:glycosyltransferase family 2 protein [Cryobacterium sp.]MBX3104099.1 glycosyltransferase family 2 protein [Cryobacterium sp.]